MAEDCFVLKEITDPELRGKLSRAEFKSLKELHHPNLPRVYEIFASTSPFHLKLEYVMGGRPSRTRGTR